MSRTFFSFSKMDESDDDVLLPDRNCSYPFFCYHHQYKPKTKLTLPPKRCEQSNFNHHHHHHHHHYNNNYKS